MATNPPDNGDPGTPPPPNKEEQDGIPADANYLVTYTRHLERSLKNLEQEKQLIDTERLRLERELHAMRTELDRLRQPPLIEATVIKILEDKRAVVESSTGPRFIVNMSKKVKSAGLQSGQHVALNQRTFAIVEAIPLGDDEILKRSTPVPVKVVTSPDDKEMKETH